MITFGAGFNLKFDFLAIFQGFISLTLDRHMMHEDIRTFFLNNKAVTFLVVKPFDFPYVPLLTIPFPRIGYFVSLKSFSRSNPRWAVVSLGLRL